MANRRCRLTVTCRRPRNRACDDWHVQPERIAKTVAMFMGEGAELTLTARTVRLHVTDVCHLPDLAFWHRRMAEVMHCLYLDVERVGGEAELPSPVRTEIREAEHQPGKEA